MGAIVLGAVLVVATFGGAGALLGWVLGPTIDRFRAGRERAAAPQLRVIDGGNKHDWRELARPAPTQRVRAIGARTRP